MALNKRIFRSYRKNKSFYIGIILLCMLAVALIIGMESAATTLENSIDEFNEETQVEDAMFMTQAPISDIKEIEEKFDVTIEEIAYVDISENNRTLRVFRETEKLNKHSLLDGNDLSGTNQILLNPEYAEKNNLALNDSYKIADNEYKIQGYFSKPDYLYLIKSGEEIYPNSEKFGIAVLQAAAFDKLTGQKIYYSAKFGNTDQIKFREYLYDEYQTIGFQLQENNIRIAHAKNQIVELRGLAKVVPTFMMLLTMVFISTILSRMLKREHKEIGMLVAIGYKKWEIMKHYSIYAIITAVIGSLLGLVLGIVTIDAFASRVTADFNSPELIRKVEPVNIIIGLTVPTVLMVATSLIVILLSLRRTPLEIMKGIQDKEQKSRQFLKGTKLSFYTKYKLRSIMRNKLRSFMFLFGITIASMIVLAGFVTNGSVHKLVKDELMNSNNSEYSYHMYTLQDGVPDDGEPFLAGNYETEDDNAVFTVMGISNDSKHFQIKTVDGDKLDVDKTYIGKPLATLLDCEPGDTIEFIDPATLEKHHLEIDGIADVNLERTIYMSTENMQAFMGLSGPAYTGIHSDTRLDLDDGQINYTLRKSDVVGGYETILQAFLGMIFILIVFAVIISIIVVYVTTNMLVEENRNNIAMLKVLGYKLKEINKLVLNTNTVLLFIGFVLAIPLALKVVNELLKSSVENMDIVIQASISPLEIIISFIIIFIVYKVSLMLLRKGVMDINMVESLKENRE